MTKYNIVQLTEVLYTSNNVNIENEDAAKEASKLLGKFLGEGYLIYKAIPIVCESYGSIKYILRKKVK